MEHCECSESVIQQVWGGAWGFAFVTVSPVTPVLQVTCLVTHREFDCCFQESDGLRYESYLCTL